MAETHSPGRVSARGPQYKGESPLPRLILIRHGETAWNAERRTQGWHDEPLNDRGMQQARRMGAFVREQFDLSTVWASDLRRCVQTAEPIGLPVQTSRALRELNYGEWEGRSWEELNEQERELTARLIAGDRSFRAPGGELVGDLADRVRGFVDAAGLADAADDVAVVGHGGSLRALIVAMLGLPFDAFGRFAFSNASVSVVTTGRGAARLYSLNHTAHLNGVLPLH